MNIHDAVLILLLIALLAVAPRLAYGEQGTEERAASLLFRHYETVAGANTSLIFSRNVDRSELSGGFQKLSPGEQTLRFPFLPLIAAMKAGGANLNTRLRESYRVVFVGARDFSSPAGLGLFTRETASLHF